MQKVVIAAFLFVAGVTATQVLAGEKGKMMGAATVVPSAEVKWMEAPGTPGVQTAVVEGDETKAHHRFMKLPAGFAAPLHHHSSDHYVTVISGTMVETVDGHEMTLPAGSFFGYTGQKKHETRCAAGADCVLSVDVRGKWDLVVAPGAAAGAK